MSVINVDLPDHLLAEISRMAQEFNVPRAEILRRAIHSLAGKAGTERALERLRELYADESRGRRDLADRLDRQEISLGERDRELENLRAQAGRDSQMRESLIAEKARLLAESEKATGERERSLRSLETARRAREKMGRLLSERTYLAIRSLEVERLNAHLEKAIAGKAAAEEKSARQEAKAGKSARESARLAERLAASRKKQDELLERANRHLADLHRNERDIGKLRRELERARAELRRMVKLLGGAAAGEAAPPDAGP